MHFTQSLLNRRSHFRAVEAHFNIFDGFEGALQTFSHVKKDKKMASEKDVCPSALAPKIIASLEKKVWKRPECKNAQLYQP